MRTDTVKTLPLFSVRPLVIAALHLPDPIAAGDPGMPWLEDYTITNARIFVDAGVPVVKLQDQTREPGEASLRTVARMTALARLIRQECPTLLVGIILQAHDAVAPLVVASVSGACFVRLKVFVAASMTAEGPKHGLAVRACAARQALQAHDVAILADVFDRTSVPMVDVPSERAAKWAEGLGADALVLTGANFEDSLRRIDAARAAGVRVPVVVGGGVTEANAQSALAVADGVIVSTALMRPAPDARDLVRWDSDAVARFMDAARRPAKAVET